MNAITRKGGSRQWRKIRAQVLDRDSHLCQLCGEPGNEVDHRTERRDGGDDNLDNLWTLCHTCHTAKTRKRTKQRRVFGSAGHPMTPYGPSLPEGRGTAVTIHLGPFANPLEPH